MICCTPWEEVVCAKVCESNRTPFPVRPARHLDFVFTAGHANINIVLLCKNSHFRIQKNVLSFSIILLLRKFMVDLMTQKFDLNQRIPQSLHEFSRIKNSSHSDKNC